MPTTQLKTEILETNPNITHSVIWLHGLGADGNDFVSLIPELHLPKSAAIRFIFPHAPKRPVTINNGYIMRAWYDITSLTFGQAETENDILNSVAQIQHLIKNEIKAGISPQNILLAGFSQGGVIALHAALRFPTRLAGVMALSTYLPFADNLIKEMANVQQDLPIFAAHGQLDSVIPIEKAQNYNNLLKEHGFKIQYQTYHMEHSLCIEEIQDIRKWLLENFLEN